MVFTTIILLNFRYCTQNLYLQRGYVVIYCIGVLFLFD